MFIKIFPNHLILNWGREDSVSSYWFQCFFLFFCFFCEILELFVTVFLWTFKKFKFLPLNYTLTKYRILGWQVYVIPPSKLSFYHDCETSSVILIFIPLIVIDISSLSAFKTFFFFLVVWVLKFQGNISVCRIVFDHPVKNVIYSVILKVDISFQSRKFLSHCIFYFPLFSSSKNSIVCFL